MNEELVKCPACYGLGYYEMDHGTFTDGSPCIEEYNCELCHYEGKVAAAVALAYEEAKR